MTTDELNAIWERMEKLNPKNQDMIAKKILEEIEAMEWDEIWDETFASLESQAFSAKQRKEAIAEHLAGETLLYRGGSLAKLFQQEV
ncbi:MAG TPA: hypothetical protein VN207_03465 [Ktedonobacteraceae bacterium]|nr:hypothetical protein [Ktedonobacteraceae bacterium]